MNISQRLRACAKHTGLDAVIELLQEAADEIDAMQARAILTQQPATGEPVWCVATGERVNGEETYTHHDAYVPLADCFPLYTRPAPSVRADVVRVPLQVLKDASEALGNFVSDHGWGDTDMQAMDNLDAYIARHDAKAQK